MAYKIKFGTDGWRAIIADTYTVENVRRVAHATALWCNQNKENSSIVIGYDCRFGGEMFMKTSAEVFAFHGIKVLLSKEFVSTPMVSLATQKTGSFAGIVITASHNPPSYNGFKIKAHYGGPASPIEIDKVEKLIPDSLDYETLSFDAYLEKGEIGRAHV